MSADPTTVAPAGLPDLGPGTAPGAPAGLDVLADVQMEVTVELGRVRMTVRELLSLQPGNVVELDRLAGSPVDVLVNGTTIGRGELVVVGDELGVRMTQIEQRR